MSLLRLARRPAIVMSPEGNVIDAVNVMMDNSIGAVGITEDGKLIGIFTERDVMLKVVSKGLDPNTTKLNDVLTRNIVTIRDNQKVNEALDIMSERRIRHIPVLTADGEIGGMLSLRFLLHDRLEDLLSDLNSLESFIAADGPGG